MQLDFSVSFIEYFRREGNADVERSIIPSLLIRTIERRQPPRLPVTWFVALLLQSLLLSFRT